MSQRNWLISVAAASQSERAEAITGRSGAERYAIRFPESGPVPACVISVALADLFPGV